MNFVEKRDKKREKQSKTTCKHPKVVKTAWKPPNA